MGRQGVQSQDVCLVACPMSWHHGDCIAALQSIPSSHSSMVQVPAFMQAPANLCLPSTDARYTLGPNPQCPKDSYEAHELLLS